MRPWNKWCWCLGAGLTLLAPASAMAVSDCQVREGVDLAFNNYEFTLGFWVYCSSGHYVVARFAGYDSAGNVVHYYGGPAKWVAPGSWHYITNHDNWGVWKPVVNACIWIDRDNPPTVQLHAVCRVR